MTYKNCVTKASQALGKHDIWLSMIHFIALVNNLYCRKPKSNDNRI